MIKLFVLDIDGCISMPFETPFWDSITSIKALNEQSNVDAAIPPITICSGRPLPYVEAVGQWLGVYYPLVFESGGGIYDTDANRIHWAPEFNESVQNAVNDLKVWVQTEIVKKYPGTLPEFAKQTDVGIIHKDESLIIEIYNTLKNKVKQAYPFMEVHRTEISVNCILSNANKGNGLKRLSEMTGISLNEMAYIGDSSGDISALKIVGMPFAPSNATFAVKEVAQTVQGKATDGVLEAYRNIINKNGA